MLFLLAAVLCSVLLGFMFKVFPRFGIDTFQAIVFNYCTCLVCGILHLGRFPLSLTAPPPPWLPFALGLGLVFISGFNAAAATVRQFSLTLSQIMQRMSILLTVPFAWFMYHESAGWGKIAGFVCAIGAIIFVNLPGKSPAAQKTAGGLWWLPLVTWILAGVIEMVFTIVQNEGLNDPNDPSFVATIFGTAGVIGLLMAAQGWRSGRLRFSWRHVAAGIMLGIPNYGSMFFLIKALGAGLEASFVFPTVNVSIIFITTIGAIVLFQEQLSNLNRIGIALAVAAILLIFNA